MTPYEIIANAIKNQKYLALYKICIAWIIFEALLAIYKGYAAVSFTRSFLGKKSGVKHPRLWQALFWFSYSAIFITEYFFCGIFNNYWYIPASVPLTAILMIYAYLFCNGKTAEKIFAPLAANTVIVALTVITNLMNLEIGGRMRELIYVFMVKDAAEILAVLIILPTFIYFSLYVILRIFRKTDISGKNSLLQWAAISVLLTLSVSSSVFLFMKYAFDPSNRLRLTIFSGIVILSFILADIFVFLLISDILKKNKAVNELNLIRQTEEYNRQYIKNMQSEYETVRKLRHDYKNSLLMLSTLLERGETEKALDLIKENLGEINKTEVFISTGNAVVNAVANAKLSAAKSMGIECECFAAKDISGINDYDLCRLLSNMLDNAISGCKSAPGGCRRLSLSVRSEEGVYIFTVKNTVAESVLETNPGLKSTKKKPGEHGYGVKIIREIAEKYSGRSDFYEEEGMFCCSVLLNAGEG